MKRFLSLFEYNSPVILTFSLIAVSIFALDSVLPQDINYTLFTYYGGVKVIDFVRLFLWPFGHASISHLLGNFTFILLIGPMLEEKYGSKLMMIAMLVTTLVIGIIHAIFFSGGILGASGIVFMMIIMTSFTGVKQSGKIPVTFICIAALYLGQEVYRGLFTENNVSEISHIIGGITGIFFAKAHQKNHYREDV
jgi:GlpG protein